MVFTLLHPGFLLLPYLTLRNVRRKTDPIALTISSMIPDIEAVILYIYTYAETSRILLHSIMGALSLGALISILILYIIQYLPWKLHALKLVGLGEWQLIKTYRVGWKSLLSVYIGLMSHIVIDSFHYHNPSKWEGSPLLFPFTDEKYTFLLFGEYSRTVWHGIGISIGLLVLAIIIYTKWYGAKSGK